MSECSFPVGGIVYQHQLPVYSHIGSWILQHGFPLGPMSSASHTLGSQCLLMSQERLQWYHAERILYTGYLEFHGVQLLGCGANHPLPSSARLQMGWSYISSYHLCWHGVIFTFTVPKVMHFCSRWCWT